MQKRPLVTFAFILLRLDHEPIFFNKIEIADCLQLTRIEALLCNTIILLKEWQPNSKRCTYTSDKDYTRLTLFYHDSLLFTSIAFSGTKR